jgi:hypothetical protein
MQGESNKIRHFVLSHQIQFFQTRSAPCPSLPLRRRRSVHESGRGEEG